jgi:hypothetical protein
MKNNRQLSTLLVSTLVLIALIVVLTNMMSEDGNRDLADAEFLVS